MQEDTLAVNAIGIEVEFCLNILLMSGLFDDYSGYFLHSIWKITLVSVKRLEFYYH